MGSVMPFEVVLPVEVIKLWFSQSSGSQSDYYANLELFLPQAVGLKGLLLECFDSVVMSGDQSA